MNKTNEFAMSCSVVKNIVDEYKQIRKDCNITSTDYQIQSIESKANPFLKGYFTLAIVGKVSSGKSTFINALLGNKDLLPVGHDQTTCGITYIEYGEHTEATITFGDNSTKSISGNNVGEELKKYVAIPNKFHHLPVNAIDEMILAGYSFSKIWGLKKELEDTTLCPTINEKELREYIELKPKINVVKSVSIKFPFNEELKGWRIIDTPGVGAIGGIEDATKKLLEKKKENGAREVDSIIFLQKGNETLDQTDTKKFVQDQLDNFSESDKSRLFFVLTHASDENFLNYKDSKLESIQKYYEKHINKLSYVDSLLNSFLNELEYTDIDLCSFVMDLNIKLNNWCDNELMTVRPIIYRAQMELMKLGESVNNETLLRKLTEWANFNMLKSEINEFAKNECAKTVSKILKLIEEDYGKFIYKLTEDNSLLSGNLDAIKKRIEDTKKKEISYSKSIRDAENKTSAQNISSYFSFVDEEIRNVSNLQSIPLIRTAITNLVDNVNKKEKEVFIKITNTYKTSLYNQSFNDVVLDKINFENIISKSTTTEAKSVKTADKKTIKEGVWSPKDKIIPAKYVTTYNEKVNLDQFKAHVMKEIRSRRDKFNTSVKIKADNISKNIVSELDKKIKDEFKRLEKLKLDLNNKEEKITNNTNLKNNIKSVLVSLNK